MTEKGPTEALFFFFFFFQKWAIFSYQTKKNCSRPTAAGYNYGHPLYLKQKVFRVASFIAGRVQKVRWGEGGQVKLLFQKSSQVIVPNFNIIQFKNSILYKGSSMWNELHNETKNIPSKKKPKSYLNSETYFFPL